MKDNSTLKSFLTFGQRGNYNCNYHVSHQVLSVRAQTPNQVELLKELMDKHDEVATFVAFP